MADFRCNLHCKHCWRVWALSSASVILLIMCFMCKPVRQVLLLVPTSPKAPERSKFSSDQAEYYYNYYSARKHRFFLRRILDDVEHPYPRPAPRSYPPPQDSVQTFGVDEQYGRGHGRASPPSMNFHPQCKRSHPPLAHP